MNYGDTIEEFKFTAYFKHRNDWNYKNDFNVTVDKYNF